MALRDIIEPYFVGAGGRKVTPEQIERERRLAQTMINAGIDTSPVGHWTQGAARMMSALAGNIKQARADKAESDGISSAAKKFAGLDLGSLLGGGAAYPSSVAAGGSPTSAAATGTVPQGKFNFGENADALRNGIVETAQAIGADPVDLATAISYETAGTFDPTKAGPRTQYGQHRGLIQFGEPQAEKYGVDWNNPLASQLGANGAVANYFRSSGFKPGMSGLDLYSTINAGSPGRYSASDANNGGAPGDVRDKWENQMAGHRQKALALLGGGASATPVQVASNDPSIGLAQAYSAEPQPQTAAAAIDQVSPRDMAAIPTPAAAQPQAAGPSAELLRQNDIAFGGALAPQGSAPVQVADASGYFPAAPSADRAPIMGSYAAPVAPQTGGNIQQLLEAASDPWMNDSQRRIIGMALQNNIDQGSEARKSQAARENWLFQQQYEEAAQAPDPLRQAQLVEAQAKVRALQSPDASLPDSVRALNIRAQQAGLVPGTEEYQQFMISGGKGPLVTVNNGQNSSKFVEKSDEAAATRFDDIVTAGQTAPQTMSDMQQLLDLGTQIGTGKGAQVLAAIGPYADALGIKIDGLSDIQAYEAITSRLAPQMRAVGSGSSSDRDVAMFLQSLPNLRNSPGGNEIIANTMKAVAQNKINAANIARQAQSGEIKWQDADRQISQLPNPYELFKQFQTETQKATGGWNDVGGGVKIRVKP